MKYPIENTELALFRGVGRYGIPQIEPETDISIDKLVWIPFNFAMSAKDCSKKGVHFFIHDYQFERVWNDPDRYIPILQKFGAVISPDFSMYVDHPEAVQIFNHYKRHWLAAYWQMHGIKVIPSIGWVEEKNYEWCFDGEPKNSIIAISSLGLMQDPEVKKTFEKGCKKALDELNPSKILWYGKPIECIEDRNATIIKPFYKSLEERKNNEQRRK